MNESPYVCRKVYEYIIENDGGTFSEDGRPLEFDDGFMVSVPDCEYKIPLKYFNYAHIESHAAFLNNEGVDAYFGAWVDGDMVYLDASVHVSHEATARHLGKLWHQISVYDCANKCVITL